VIVKIAHAATIAVQAISNPIGTIGSIGSVSIAKSPHGRPTREYGLAQWGRSQVPWLLTRKDYIVPIPGARNPQRVGQNVSTAEVDLTPDDLATIEQIAPKGGVGGPM
jgi:diketogulonate reductase-like aldo/keto reductase